VTDRKKSVSFVDILGYQSRKLHFVCGDLYNEDKPVNCNGKWHAATAVWKEHENSR